MYPDKKTTDVDFNLNFPLTHLKFIHLKAMLKRHVYTVNVHAYCMVLNCPLHSSVRHTHNALTEKCVNFTFQTLGDACS